MKVEHIFVIVPNLEDFRIDRVHLFKLSRHSPAAHHFPAADVSSVASIAKSSSKVPRVRAEACAFLQQIPYIQVSAEGRAPALHPKSKP
jgi:hypothetical protein